MKKRKARVVRIRDSFVALLPMGRIRGNEIDKGAVVDIESDWVVTFRVQEGASNHLAGSG